VAKLEADVPRTKFTNLNKNDLPPVSLTRKDRATLSKAWELGTDTVALQTVVLIDGDIITRVSAEYAGEQHQIVRQIHKEAVDLSMRTWELLTKTFGGLADTLFKRKQ
jgi:hypothetical protein